MPGSECISVTVCDLDPFAYQTCESPPRYSVSVTVTDTCTGGSIGEPVTGTASYTSNISYEDAVERATALAHIAARNARLEDPCLAVAVSMSVDVFEDPIAIDVLAEAFIGTYPIDRVQIVNAPLHGTASVQADNTILYEVTSTEYDPSDLITFRLVDTKGNISNNANVVISIFYGEDLVSVVCPSQDNWTGLETSFPYSNPTHDLTDFVVVNSGTTPAGSLPTTDGTKFIGASDTGLIYIGCKAPSDFTFRGEIQTSVTNQQDYYFAIVDEAGQRAFGFLWSPAGSDTPDHAAVLWCDMTNEPFDQQTNVTASTETVESWTPFEFTKLGQRFFLTIGADRNSFYTSALPEADGYRVVIGTYTIPPDEVWFRDLEVVAP
jgi:hypothetical protein